MTTNIEFIPNDSEPSNAEKTVYNVFINTAFTGYIHLAESGYWWFYKNGKRTFGSKDRCDVFQQIKDIVSGATK